MKKFISGLLAIAVFFSFATTTLATEPKSVQLAASQDFRNEDHFTKNAVYFEISKAIKKSSLASDEVFKINNSNLLSAEQMVKDLNLAALGFVDAEEYFLAQIEGLKKSEIIIEKYELFVPASTVVTLGTYNGVPVQAIYSVYDGTPYTRISTNNTNIGHYLLGTLDLAMVFAATKVALPYTILRTLTSAQRQTLAGVTGKTLELYTTEEITTRLLNCKDVLGLYGPTSQYIGVLSDMAKYCVLEEIIKHSSPFVPTTVSGVKSETVYTTNFTNASAMCRDAYNIYITNAYNMTIRSIPQGNLLFS